MLEITQTQRYYHFVALRGAAKRIRNKFFVDRNIQRGDLVRLPNTCTVRHLRVTSDYQYYRGNDNIFLNGRLVFDGVLFDHHGLNLTLLGFPFKRLTNDLVDYLVTRYDIVSGGKFVSADMGKLIKANENETDFSVGSNHFFLAGVNLTLKGDTFLSTVKLEGDKPLDSDLYKDYFQERVLKNESRLEKCTMKCAVATPPNLEAGRTVSSIHIDKFGNYKLYVNSQGRNLITLPAVFEFLDSIDCLSETPYTPTAHIIGAEDDEN